MSPNSSQGSTNRPVNISIYYCFQNTEIISQVIYSKAILSLDVFQFHIHLTISECMNKWCQNHSTKHIFF